MKIDKQNLLHSKFSPCRSKQEENDLHMTAGRCNCINKKTNNKYMSSGQEKSNKYLGQIGRIGISNKVGT